ncbi:MAG TPA: hypothetical protein VIJ87_10495, partial [Pyrinomonadaceae bacterium]
MKKLVTNHDDKLKHIGHCTPELIADPIMTNPLRLHAGGHQLEYVWLGPAPDQAPTIVFLHEGLGSVAMWRDFPQQVVETTGYGALVYSRAGYG